MHRKTKQIPKRTKQVGRERAVVQFELAIAAPFSKVVGKRVNAISDLVNQNVKAPFDSPLRRNPDDGN